MEKTIQNIPFLRITIALIAGIVIGNHLALDASLGVIIVIILLLSLFIANQKYKYSFTIPFGIGIHLVFILLGITIVQSFNKKPQLFSKGEFIAVVMEIPQEKENSYRSLLQINAVHFSDTTLITKEFVIAYFSKDEKAISLKAGDIIVSRSIPQEIKNQNNPYEFDYKKYLERKRIYRQVYLSSEQWAKTNLAANSLIITAENIREKLLQIYRSQPIGKTELEILSALTLGYKRDLDPETKRVFSASGASHVLAVSGLHVGIVFWVISLLFGFLKKNKSGRILFIIISISFLWFYTFITGLSPSVMRAATMFSIFVIGDNLNRKSNIYNSLAASAFILLLINPNNLFDVGFQLSYSAVFGIVFLQPKFEKQFIIKNKHLKFFWSLITVSVAAQIATFPLTTYYFGQFPSYFWITNTFIIPVVMAIIPLGISLLFVSNIQFLSNLLAVVLNTIIKLSFLLLSFIENLPFAVWEISVNQVQFIFIIVTVCSFMLYLNNQKSYYLKSALLSTLIVSLSGIYTDIKQFNQREIIVYNTSKNQSIHLIKNKKNLIISDKIISQDEFYFHPAKKTIQKLKLEKPVFLISTDSVTNNDIALLNGFAVFEGKSFSLNKTFNDLIKNNLPDFIINPIIYNQDSIGFKTNTKIISNKRYLYKNEIDSDKIHYTFFRGAFRKKW